MSDDAEPPRDDQQPKPGFRKDGKPFKPNNTRADGSFEVGKNRTSKEHQFKVGDGRKRGPRPRGSKNLVTEWNDELNAKIVVTENGMKKKITKRRSLIKTQIERGLRSSDRAAETAFRYAELNEKRNPGLQVDDREIIERFVATVYSGEERFDGVYVDAANSLTDGNGNDGDGVTGDA